MQTFAKIQKLQKFDVSSMKQTLCPQEPVKLLLFINLDPHNLKWFHRSLPEENLVYKLNRVKLFTTFIKNFHKITGGFRLTSWKKQISYTSLEKSKTVLHLKQNLKMGTKCLRKKLPLFQQVWEFHQQAVVEQVLLQGDQFFSLSSSPSFLHLYHLCPIHWKETNFSNI